MTQYFIQDGFSVKGPFSLEELKRLKIDKQTYVRQSESDAWIQAGSVYELRNVVRKKNKVLRFLGLIAALFFLVIVVVNVSLYQDARSLNAYNVNNEPVPVPPGIDYKTSRINKDPIKELFKDCNISGDKRQLVKACNYQNSSVRNTAVSVAGRSPGNFNLGQICDIFDYCFDNWKYVNDPRARDWVEYASTTLANGLNGDCDDFAVLVCSMILAIGGEARISYAYGAESGHAFTEVNIGQTELHEIVNYISKRYKYQYSNQGIHSRLDRNGNRWLNLDWFAQHPGGKYFDYSDGTVFYIAQGYCERFTK